MDRSLTASEEIVDSLDVDGGHLKMEEMEMSDEQAMASEREREARAAEILLELKAAPLSPEEARHAACAILDVRDQVRSRKAFDDALSGCLEPILRSEVSLLLPARGQKSGGPMLRLGPVEIRAETGDISAALEMGVLNHAAKDCPQSSWLSEPRMDPVDVQSMLPDLWKSAVLRLERAQARFRMGMLADSVDGESAALSGMSKQEFLDLVSLAWDRALVESVQEEDPSKPQDGDIRLLEKATRKRFPQFRRKSY